MTSGVAVRRRGVAEERGVKMKPQAGVVGICTGVITGISCRSTVLGEESGVCGM